MSVLPPSLFEALEADASLWPGAERVRAAASVRAGLELRLASVPADVQQVLLSAMVDPERNDWSRATLLGLGLAASGGATAMGLATDDVVEMRDARGERFGLLPLGYRLPDHPLGEPEDVDRLLRGLDGAFGHRRFVLCVRRPLPPNLDVAPICSAVQLWLAQSDRSDTRERHAVYEDELIALDLTVIDDDPRREAGGRLLTFGPALASERLDLLQDTITHAAALAEESLGGMPLVVVVAADRPWALPRGLVQHRLYGLADWVTTASGTYEAEFVQSSVARFAHPSLRAVAAVWLLEPGPGAATAEADPLQSRSRAYENPWSSSSLALGVAGPRFAPVGEAEPRLGRVVLRWGSR